MGKKRTYMDEEHILISRAQNGDMGAFRELVENHKKLVFHYSYDLTGNVHDSEDLSQEVFIKMFRALNSFRGESKLSSWLFRITSNTWISMIRSKNMNLHRIEVPLSESVLENRNGTTKHGENPEKTTEATFIQADIQAALEKLTPRERSVFVLRHYHELSTAEVGSILRIADGTVKSLLFRAVKKLRHYLAPYRSKQLGRNG